MYSNYYYYCVIGPLFKKRKTFVIECINAYGMWRYVQLPSRKKNCVKLKEYGAIVTSGIEMSHVADL